jgi:SAM-dependent methyltransferase
MHSGKTAVKVTCLAFLLLARAVTADGPQARRTRYAELEAVIDAHAALAPVELRTATGPARDQRWTAWIASHDRAIRARLARGDEDTIVNWMLFGGSFTSQPPAVSAAQQDQEAEARRVAAIMRARAQDLVRALAAPSRDERILFARRLLEARQLSFASDAGRAGVLQYLIESVVRVATEQERIDRELAAARTAPDSARQLETAARVFRTRGLSLDTSLAPNFAIEQALAAMKAGALLGNGGIRRVAVVGPGLDFSDKDSGFDFYPLQTLQPFAVVDSLRRLQLGAAGPEVVVLDISPRVIDHVNRAAARAAKDEGYTLYLPLATQREWLPSFRSYWRQLGDQIGATVAVDPPRSVAAAAELRAIRIPADLAQRVTVSDLNIVTDRLDGEGFDLIVATNVFVYYDLFDQALAVANVASMLRPGGYFLSNTALPDAGRPALRLAGSNDVTYWRTPPSGDEPTSAFGDRIFWYQR